MYFDYETEIIKYQAQVNRFMVVLNKKELLPSVIQWQNIVPVDEKYIPVKVINELKASFCRAVEITIVKN